MPGMCLHRGIYLLDSALITSRDVSNGEISGSGKVNGKKITATERPQGYPHSIRSRRGGRAGRGYLLMPDTSLTDVFSIFPPEPFFPSVNEVGIIYKFLILFELNLPPVGFNAGSYLFFLLGPYRQHRGSC